MDGPHRRVQEEVDGLPEWRGFGCESGVSEACRRDGRRFKGGEKRRLGECEGGGSGQSTQGVGKPASDGEKGQAG